MPAKACIISGGVERGLGWRRARGMAGPLFTNLARSLPRGLTNRLLLAPSPSARWRTPGVGRQVSPLPLLEASQDDGQGGTVLWYSSWRSSTARICSNMAALSAMKWRISTKLSMILMLTSMAVSLRSTVESIDTPLFGEDIGKIAAASAPAFV